MTRSELVDVVYRRHGGISRREAQALLDIILGLVSERLAAGETVDVAGFGSFAVVRVGGRLVRHPVTGRRTLTAGRKDLLFRPSRILDRALNAVPQGSNS